MRRVRRLLCLSYETSLTFRLGESNGVAEHLLRDGITTFEMPQQWGCVGVIDGQGQESLSSIEGLSLSVAHWAGLFLMYS